MIINIKIIIMSKKENSPSDEFHNFMSAISVKEDTIEGYKYWFRRKIVTKTGSYKKADSFDYTILNDYFEKGISIKEAFNTIFNIEPKKTK